MSLNLRFPPWLAFLAFAWPAACLATGCDCASLCAVVGAAGCIAVAALAALALFVPLGIIEELRLLAHLDLRGTSAHHAPKEKT